jgi:ribosomal protein L11 methyltransferase
MRWLALDFATTHEASELLTDFLSSLGADGVQVQDAEEFRSLLADPASLAYADDGFIDSLDEKVRIRAYFAEFPEGVRRNRDIGLTTGDLYDDVEKIMVPLTEMEALIRERLADFAGFLDIGEGYQGWQEVREEDWADGWKKYYQTLHLTDRLVINPSWIDYQPAVGEIVIALDPGSAFGTGTHETTALCAELLDELLMPGDAVLDLGTGSGILAIIAGKLGSSPVEAIDIDQLAVGVAAENCRINAVTVDCHPGELSGAHRTSYDLIVANIIADVIVALTPDIPARLNEDGLLIASGIISDRFGQVASAAGRAGLELLIKRERRDWCAAVFRKQTARLLCYDGQ